ncbi:glycoside hydrolase family 5 protein [bacterium]|nr:glycoside hydrolase family 5 protein [bacterium]
MRTLALLFAFSAPVFANWSTEGTYLRDSSGRVAVFRGLNVSASMKVPPFTSGFRASDLDPLPKWGINAIRLLFIWEAAEPKEGVYDRPYLTWYKNVVKEAAKRGIYVLVDIHQDAYSRFATDGCGAGFPDWTVAAPLKKPDNSDACAPWGLKELTDAQTKESFRSLYAPGSKVRARFLKMAETLVELLNDCPKVLGYDLNEPWGDWDSDLLPLYADMAGILQKKDPQKILFLEPSLGRISIAPGLTVSPNLTRPTFDHFILAPHYYDIQTLIFGKRFVDFTRSEVGKIQKQASKWNVPWAIGEFGVEPIEAQYAEWDRHFVSNFQWSYTPDWTPEARDHWNAEDTHILDSEGKFRRFRVKPFAERIAGMPKTAGESGGGYSLTWDNDPSQGTTVLFVPSSPEIQTSPPELRCRYVQNGQRVECSSPLAGTHTVRIRSKS